MNTLARYIHKRAILILGKRLPSILQKLGGEGAGERTGVVMPAKPPFARERAQVGIAFMDCMRVARDVHAPGVSLGLGSFCSPASRSLPLMPSTAR